MGERDCSRLAKVIRPEIQPGTRVLAVSDIHGNLPFLQGLLEKVSFGKDDVLVLVGDLMEKGYRSLETLRYVMDLCKRYTVYPLCGNCDYIDRMFLSGDPVFDDALWPVLQYWGRRALLDQMRIDLGVPPLRGPEDLPALREAIRMRLPEETAFLLDLPQILAAGKYLFVHGGVPREDDLEHLLAYPLMKFDDFRGQGLSFQHWVVTGHWPVTLYRLDIPDATPIIDQDTHIVSIDGGCVLKLDGQLNALIIPDITQDTMTWDAFDGLPLVEALEDQAASENSINIRWSDSVIEVLRESGDSAYCRHISSGRELWIPKRWLWEQRGQLHTEDTTDYLLPVHKGDLLSLAEVCDQGILAKKDGASGWYLGKWRPLQPLGDWVLKRSP